MAAIFNPNPLSPDGLEPPARAARAWNKWTSRQLLSAAEFELSSLLPANGGDGSKGFVTTGIVDRGVLGIRVSWLPASR